MIGTFMEGISRSPVRFAPSTTGYAHPGTLLSALLCWLDARSRGARFILRLENLDPERSRPEYERAMEKDLRWFGLDWDERHRQSDFALAHERALDVLAENNLLYPCHCSRSRLKKSGQPAPDGGFAYDNHCRQRELPAGGWRATREPLRLRLDHSGILVTEEDGGCIRQHPASEMGDPVVRRRDHSVAYHLATVVDDHHAGIVRLIRGRDLAPVAPVQILIHRALQLPVPSYRHHLLLLEKHGGKLAKFHGAVGTPELKKHYRPEELCGLLAHACGLLPDSTPCRPGELLAAFDWRRVVCHDLVAEWDGRRLTVAPHPTRRPAH